MSGTAPILASPARRRRLAAETVILTGGDGPDEANWGTPLSVLNLTDATAHVAGADESDKEQSTTPTPAGKTTATDLLCPPSFAESQLLTIVTRQVSRPKDGGGIKAPRTTRFPNLPHGSTWEFSGWGVTVHVELDADACRTVKGDGRVMGTLEACGLAGSSLSLAF